MESTEYLEQLFFLRMDLMVVRILCFRLIRVCHALNRLRLLNMVGIDLKFHLRYWTTVREVALSDSSRENLVCPKTCCSSSEWRWHSCLLLPSNVSCIVSPYFDTYFSNIIFCLQVQLAQLQYIGILWLVHLRMKPHKNIFLVTSTLALNQNK